MFVIQLLLAWSLLYFALKFIFDTVKPDKDVSSSESGPEPTSQDRSSYLGDVPDALRPDIEAEDFFDPTDFM